MPKSLLCLERTCGRSDCEIVSYSEFFLYDFTKGNRRAARGPGLLPARHRLPAFRNFAGHPPPHMVYLIHRKKVFPMDQEANVLHDSQSQAYDAVCKGCLQCFWNESEPRCQRWSSLPAFRQWINYCSRNTFCWLIQSRTILQSFQHFKWAQCFLYVNIELWKTTHTFR